MAPWLADCATPTTLSAGRSTSARLVKVERPVTVTSALSASCSVASTRRGPGAATSISRRTAPKLMSEKDTTARPAGTPSKR
jgi:hypothetical protein